jgi:hypothetical protein
VRACVAWLAGRSNGLDEKNVREPAAGRVVVNEDGEGAQARVDGVGGGDQLAEAGIVRVLDVRRANDDVVRITCKHA